MPQIEKLHIGVWWLQDELCDTIFRRCSNLKRLSIKNNRSNKVISDENLWLLRQCPLLHHIVLNDRGEFGDEIDELKKFFELNSKIQIFSTTFDFIWNNRNCFLGSNIKFDRLDVTGNCFEMHALERACTVLNQLYDQGFYERVHMYRMLISNQDEINQISSVHSIEKFYSPMLPSNITLPQMPYLREFALCKFYFGDLEINEKNLINLERVYFKKARSNVLTLLLQSAPKVKEIKVVKELILKMAS